MEHQPQRKDIHRHRARALRERGASLLKLLQKGAGDRVVVSHESVWCWRGTPIPKAITLGGNLSNTVRANEVPLTGDGKASAGAKRFVVMARNF